jgi:hypothetical protein
VSENFRSRRAFRVSNQAGKSLAVQSAKVTSTRHASHQEDEPDQNTSTIGQLPINYWRDGVVTVPLPLVDPLSTVANMPSPSWPHGLQSLSNTSADSPRPLQNFCPQGGKQAESPFSFHPDAPLADNKPDFAMISRNELLGQCVSASILLLPAVKFRTRSGMASRSFVES